MKMQKRRMEFFSFYDHTGMERHLEQMAEKGWILEKIGNLGWVYRRESPQKVHVKVSYDPKGSQFDPEMEEKGEEKAELCHHTGWKLMAHLAQFQVFYNWEDDPVPMETDPEMEVNSIHRTAKRTYLPVICVWFGIAAVYLYLFGIGIANDLMSTLSDTTALFRGFLGLLLLILVGTELVGYLRWYTKAKKLAQQGEFWKTKSKGVIQRTVCWMIVVTLVLWLTDMLVRDNPAMRLAAVTSIVLILYASVAIPQLIRVMRRKKVSKQINETVTACLVFLVPLLVVGGMIAMIVGADWHNQDRGSGMAQYLQEPPLNIEQLLAVDGQQYTQQVWAKESPLLGTFKMMETEEWELLENEDAPELTYTLVQLHIPSLYRWCCNSYLEGEYRETDPEPWLADAAYQYMDGDHPLSGYLLCYSDRLVRITFSWKPTQEQMSVVGEKLGGI